MVYNLTDSDKRHFQEHGCLILHGLIEPALMDRLESQLWNALDVERNDPGSWVGRTNVRLDRPEEAHTGAMLELSAHANIWGIAQQMVGTGVLRPPDGVDAIINWPNPAANWSIPVAGHIDGYNVQHRYTGFMVGVTVYARPVRHRGGAFIYWPDSHRKAWDHFKDHPWLDEDGHDPFSSNPRLGGALGAGTEFLGEPGDLLFWHFLLTHNGSTNAGRDVRFGLIMRWRGHDQAQIVEDRTGDMWHAWAGMPSE